MDIKEILKTQWADYESIIPGLQIKYKDEHWVWKLLPKCVRSTATSIGRTIWMPSKNWYTDNFWTFVVTAHEFQHALDWIRYGAIGFVVRYFFPQIMAIIPFVATIVTLCFGLWWFALGLFCLTGLLISPWPSKTRTEIERRGYSMNLAVQFLVNGTLTDLHCRHIGQTMKSSTYYWMHRGNIDELIEEMIDNVTGPRWPRDLAAFSPTAGVLLANNWVCDKAKEAFRWPKR